ncbi:hypothetical protein NYG22_000182 [Vibrio alginolyticus]|nr:hypothetical protein [Vibrio alginolyticus]
MQILSFSALQMLALSKSYCENILPELRGAKLAKSFEKLIHFNEVCCGSDFSVEEVKGYRAIEALNAVLPRGRGGVSLIEFAKSAHWAMSFLNGYAFKELYHRNINKP